MLRLRPCERGKSGLAPCAFETVSIPTYTGEVPGLDQITLKPELARFDCRNNRLAAMTLSQDGFCDAVAKAREKYGARRIGLFLGTSTSGIHSTEIAYRERSANSGALPKEFCYAETHNTFSLAEFVRHYLHLEGPAVMISAACASTTKAFGNAARMIETGICDAAIVGGADSLCLTTLYGFHSLALTSEAPCRPFDAYRNGISIGEGAGFVLLEKIQDGDGESVRLIGIGESSDAYHMSSPHPEGLGARMAMELALASADMNAEDIDYIKLHGTATQVGDAAEDQAIAAVFGPDTPCSSVKGHIGHTLGASGVIETIMAALGLVHGFTPGSVHTQVLDPSMKSRVLLETCDASLNYIMSNSFGFGGSNCSLILGRPS